MPSITRYAPLNGLRYAELPRVHGIPNGGDFASFEQNHRAQARKPDDVSAIPHPRFGYSGTLRSQIDAPLLVEVAGRSPTYSPVLIGDVTREIAQSASYHVLAALPNVYFVGDKANALPAYLAALDGGLLPYELEGGAAGYIYPLKMLEYLAAGLPVVSTAIPAVFEFSDVVSIVGSSEWVSASGDALATCDESAREGRRAVAAGDIWDDRVAQISTLIAARLAEKR